MAANVESLFSVREKPWHGLGTIVMEAPASAEALRLAGLDWKVVQEPVYTGNHELVKGYKANVRSTDRRVLGVVSERYKVVQNVEAFSFTDELLGSGVRYETAGSLRRAGRYGSLQGSQGSISLQGRESALTWCFPIPMTAPAP